MAENRMGYMPEGELLLRLSVPMMFSMMVQALYNVVDSLFVAQLSEDALTAVSLAFPILNLVSSIAIGTAVGINAILSKRLGEKNQKAVNSVAFNGIVLGFFTSVAAFIVGILFTEYFYTVQIGASNITELGILYTTILMLCAVFPIGSIIFERLLIATGNTFYAMSAQVLGSIINIILDPIMIFGWFGCPAMGIAGAAIATATGQFFQLCLALVFNLKKNREIQFNFKKSDISFKTMVTIYKVGVPSMIMISIGSFMVFGLNKILLAFSSTAAAVLGVYFKLQSVIFMPTFGLNQGMIPVIAYNYGARKAQRIMRTLRLAVLSGLAVMIAGCILFEFEADLLLKLFDASDNMLKIGVPAMKIIGIHFPFAGVCIVIGAYFQAMGRAYYSMINSFTRQILFLLPAAWILSELFGLNAIWWAFPIAEIASVTMTAYFFRKLYVGIIRPMQAG